MPFAKYRTVLSLAVQNTLVYRWNFLFRCFFGLIPLAGSLYLWSAVFDARGGAAANGFDYSAMVNYLLCILALENLTVPAEDEWQIAADIRDGRISSFLIRPIDYLGYRFANYGGTRVVYTLVTMWPVALMFWLLRAHVSPPPPDALTWVWTAIATVQAGVLQFLISYALALSAFWLLEISTIVFIFYSFEYFLSGRLFPLELMPPWFQEVARWLPFTYEAWFPVAVWTGRVQGAAVVQGLAIQAAWVMAAFLGARLMWSAGLRRYQAVGG